MASRTTYLCDHCNNEIPFEQFDECWTVKYTQGVYTGKRDVLRNQPFRFQTYCVTCTEKVQTAMRVPELRYAAASPREQGMSYQWA